MGVMNGEATPVAIMLLPAGKRSIMGLATQANTWFWKGNRQKKMTKSVATEFSRRRRISRRCAMSVGLMSEGSAAPCGGLSSGAVTFHRIRLRGVLGRRVAAHLLHCQLALDLLVEVAHHGAGLAHPQADAARETGQALRSEDHQRQQEDEGELPEAAFEHALGRAGRQDLSFL